MSTSTVNESKISICDVMKTSTSEVIRKMEQQVPPLVQNYSDLYLTNLHFLDDLFGTCYISEKKFFDKLNIDPKILKEYQRYTNSVSKFYQDWIEIGSKYLQTYAQMRMSIIKSYDQFFHTVIESYADMLSRFNEMNDIKK